MANSYFLPSPLASIFALDPNANYGMYNPFLTQALGITRPPGGLPSPLGIPYGLGVRRPPGGLPAPQENQAIIDLNSMGEGLQFDPFNTGEVMPLPGLEAPSTPVEEAISTQAPVSRETISGGIGGFGPLQMALLAAGLGILGRSGPSLNPAAPASAIGAGGLQGLQTFIALKQQEREEAAKAQELGIRREEVIGLKAWREAQLAEQQAKAASQQRVVALVAEYRTASPQRRKEITHQLTLESSPQSLLEKQERDPWIGITPSQYTPESIAAYSASIEAGKPDKSLLRVDPRQTLAAGAKAEGAYAQKFGGLIAEDDAALLTEARSAREGVAKIDDLLTHLETSDAITGLGAETLNNLARVVTFLSQSEKAGKTVSDTELLDAMLGSDVFPMIKSLGIGARGLDTPEERKFLRRVMSGEIGMNRQTLIRLAEMRRNIAIRSMEKWEDRKQTIPGEVLNSIGVSKAPTEIPKRRQPSAPPKKKDPWER